MLCLKKSRSRNFPSFKYESYYIPQNQKIIFEIPKVFKKNLFDEGFDQGYTTSF